MWRVASNPFMTGIRMSAEVQAIVPKHIPQMPAKSSQLYLLSFMPASPDDHEAAVAGARIVLTEMAKNLVWESGSDKIGDFLFPSAGAGVSRLDVMKAGFCDAPGAGACACSRSAFGFCGPSACRG